MQIVLFYTAFEESDVITRHTEFRNYGGDSIRLTRALSLSMDLKHGPTQMLELCGTALRETHAERRSIGTGISGFESRRGISSHQHNPFAALLNPETTETNGEAWAVSLVYSGNFTFQAERDMYGSVRFQAGINPFGFEWCLKPGERFATPEALLVHSSHGLEEMSLRFHRFLRTRIARGKFRDQMRPILLNTWEASYFTFTHNSIIGFCVALFVAPRKEAFQRASVAVCNLRSPTATVRCVSGQPELAFSRRFCGGERPVCDPAATYSK